jgi:ribosomal protein L44E
MWSFYHEISVGDVIMARRGRKEIAAVGIVRKRPSHDPHRLAPLDVQCHFGNHLTVVWSNYPRNKTFRSLLLRIQTLYEISPDKHKLLVGTPPPSPIDTTRWFDEEEMAFPEGKLVFRLHKDWERNPKLFDAAKRARSRRDLTLRCEVCGFSFQEKYRRLVKGFIEGHHTLPVSLNRSRTPSKVKDMALVCSNCHRTLHRHRPWLRMSEFKVLLK